MKKETLILGFFFVILCGLLIVFAPDGLLIVSSFLWVVESFCMIWEFFLEIKEIFLGKYYAIKEPLIFKNFKSR